MFETKLVCTIQWPEQRGITAHTLRQSLLEDIHRETTRSRFWGDLNFVTSKINHFRRFQEIVGHSLDMIQQLFCLQHTDTLWERLVRLAFHTHNIGRLTMKSSKLLQQNQRWYLFFLRHICYPCQNMVPASPKFVCYASSGWYSLEPLACSKDAGQPAGHFFLMSHLWYFSSHLSSNL